MTKKIARAIARRGKKRLAAWTSGEFILIYIDFHFNEDIMKVTVHIMQIRASRIGTGTESDRWTNALEEEDLAFIKRFVLASGSLKELASAYGISYPTVRLRLDRLIQKIQLLEREEAASPFERLLRLQHIDGKIDRETLKRLLDAHRAEIAREQKE